MILQELYKAKNVIVQIVWGEKVVEFYTDVFGRDDNGIYITPYLLEGKPLLLKINAHSGIVCNIFGDSPEDGKRMSWRNVDLNAVDADGKICYYVTTSTFNQIGNNDERRREDRVVITKRGNVWDEKTQKYIEVRVHDISDSGISFYAPMSFELESSFFTLEFCDTVNGNAFNFTLSCKVVRNKPVKGMMFYGCRIQEPTREFLLYGCLCRMTQNAKLEERK